MRQTKEIDELWKSDLSFAERETRFWRIGSCGFWIARREEEWWIAFEPEGDGASEPPVRAVATAEAREPEAGLVWERFVAGKRSRISVRPGLPDLPVVIRPRSPLVILPGRNARYYVSIPVWVSVFEGGEGHRELLFRRPTERQRKTWFGESDNGELCYSFSSALESSPDALEATPLTVACPVAIRNEADTALNFQRLCVRAQYLSLYSGARRLATNEVIFHFRGLDQSSQVTFRDEPPDFEKNPRRLAGPQISAAKSLIQKSFEYIKSLTQY